MNFLFLQVNGNGEIFSSRIREEFSTKREWKKTTKQLEKTVLFTNLLAVSYKTVLFLFMIKSKAVCSFCTYAYHYLCKHKKKRCGANLLFGTVIQGAFLKNFGSLGGSCVLLHPIAPVGASYSTTLSQFYFHDPSLCVLLQQIITMFYPKNCKSQTLLACHKIAF